MISYATLASRALSFHCVAAWLRLLKQTSPKHTKEKKTNNNKTNNLQTQSQRVTEFVRWSSFHFHRGRRWAQEVREPVCQASQTAAESEKNAAEWWGGGAEGGVGGGGQRHGG